MKPWRSYFDFKFAVYLNFEKSIIGKINLKFKLDSKIKLS